MNVTTTEIFVWVFQMNNVNTVEKWPLNKSENLEIDVKIIDKLFTKFISEQKCEEGNIYKWSLIYKQLASHKIKFITKFVLDNNKKA